MALVLANAPLETFYTQLLELPVAVQIGGLAIAKPLLLWVNDGLMAIFFMLVGLEVKRAVVEGELPHKRPSGRCCPTLISSSRFARACFGPRSFQRR